MNSNTTPRRTSTSVRRAVPALAIVVLAIGLGACQTPARGTSSVPQAPVYEAAEVPEGIDTSRPADRIEEELERLAQEASLAQSRPDRFAGMTADRIEDQLEREAASAAADH